MKVIKCRFQHLKSIDRTVLIPDSRCANILSTVKPALRKTNELLHHSVYCTPNRTKAHLIYTILKYRIKGWYWGKADISNAFASIDQIKAQSELKRFQIDPKIFYLFGLKKLNISSYKHSHTGLPQGFSTSPYIFNIYMNRIVEQMNRSTRWRLFIYVDDIFFCASTRKQARECLRVLRRKLERYGYKGRTLKINTKPNKKPYIAGPQQNFAALGYNFL